MKKILLFAVTHITTLCIGFGLGVYLLPILTAPKSVDAALLKEASGSAMFTASLTRDLKGSDFLHWGEGTISISEQKIVHEGRLSPGPDYKLYLVNGFVEDDAEFLNIKDNAKYIGDIKNFDGFVLDVPEGVNVKNYDTVLVWCEAFSEFITAGKFSKK